MKEKIEELEKKLYCEEISLQEFNFQVTQIQETRALNILNFLFT